MTDTTQISLALEGGGAARAVRGRRHRTATASAVWTVVLANAGAIVWLWVRGGNVTGLHRAGDVLTSLGRLTGLLSAYSALLQVLLLARLPWLERLVGFDRLSVWHRWNGHVCLDLVLAHVVLIVWGYALLTSSRSRARSRRCWAAASTPA